MNKFGFKRERAMCILVKNLYKKCRLGKNFGGESTGGGGMESIVPLSSKVVAFLGFLIFCLIHVSVIG